MKLCSVLAPILSILLSTALLGIDSDHDEMDDAWESKPQYGFNSPAACLPHADPDGDHLTNLGEFLAGTNPIVADTAGDGFNDSLSYGLEARWMFDDPIPPSTTPPTPPPSSPATLLTATDSGPAAPGAKHEANVSGYQFYSPNAIYGWSLHHNGITNGVARVPDTTLLDGATDWSVSTWFEIDVAAANNAIFGAKQPTAAAALLGAYVDGTSSGGPYLRLAVNGTWYSLVAPISAGSKWHHLAVVRDTEKAEIRAYLDGLYLGAVPAPFPNLYEPFNLPANVFTIAAYDYSTPTPPGTYGLLGGVDDFRIYRRVLEGWEAEALHQHGFASAYAAKRWDLAFLMNNPFGQADSDNDGFTNLAEKIAGSDPLLSTSVPAVLATTFQLHTRLQ